MPEPSNIVIDISDADFELRWKAWQDKNREQEKAFARKVEIVVRSIGFVGLCAFIAFVFTHVGGR